MAATDHPPMISATNIATPIRLMRIAIGLRSNSAPISRRAACIVVTSRDRTRGQLRPGVLQMVKPEHLLLAIGSEHRQFDRHRHLAQRARLGCDLAEERQLLGTIDAPSQQPGRASCGDRGWRYG